eukprot:CAMPEP_0113460860 /NCGR_PEP_ID=MMETSP0014_2-20120614/11222_1 /TAXON_ID=2857 /ORGANISM="Nitzschia sp." /LENGTH=191 /DNA_ID=CAMNT_0000352561 /DNA_START=66 /DNA_END=641 /DNA_ORIENTATION=+ /assembly_acc=CAM_ASM_000159
MMTTAAMNENQQQDETMMMTTTDDERERQQQEEGTTPSSAAKHSDAPGDEDNDESDSSSSSSSSSTTEEDEDDDDDVTVIMLDHGADGDGDGSGGGGHWVDQDSPEMRERRRNVLLRELQRVQRASFIHFLILCLIPTSLLLIVLATVFGEEEDCESTATTCEMEPRTFINAFTTRCICDAITIGKASTEP